MKKKINWFKYLSLCLFGMVVVLMSWQLKNSSLEGRNLVFKEVYIEKMQVKEFRNNLINPTAKMNFIIDAVKHYQPLTYAVISKIYDHATFANVDPGLVAGIVYVESRMNPMADNGKDVGLMQINYNTWKNKLMLDRTNLKDIDYNLKHGIWILKHYMDLHGEQALQRYNGIGPNMDRNYPKLINAWRIK